MFYLITGGSGSGKSAYAEEMICRSPFKRRVYVAAMEVYDEEGRRKVRRHQKLRQGKGFLTLEWPRKIPGVLEGVGEKEERAVLLECMSNLAANELFAGGKMQDWQETFARLKEAVCYLKEESGLLVVVTGQVFSDGVDYGPETNAYIRLLGAINCFMAEQADGAAEIVCGIPLMLKKPFGAGEK